MLSILIPTYNYNIVPLVEELHKQVIDYNIGFEILVYDDKSKSFTASNNSIQKLKNTIYKKLPKNIGRSAIRNLLAADAKYEFLLFVDAGTFPESQNFIKKYLSVKNQKVISGGMTNLEDDPDKPYTLRWLYSKKRERNVLCSSNFLIKKNIIKRLPFDESIKKYGYEDVLFFSTLIKNNISIHSINNHVYHSADDDAYTFIRKTEYAIENLIELTENNRLEDNSSKILNYYSRLKTLKLTKFTANLFKMLKDLLLKNFNSSYPSLLLYDFYRLGYFCLLKTKK